jgi:hypothetical protein
LKFAINSLYSDVNLAINSNSMRRLRTSAVILLVMFCATAEIDCAARSAKQLGTVLTGKFVARVDGPPLTGFGMNRESYVFEMFSPTGSQFVTLSNTFLIYQPHLPVFGLDYSKLYKLTAVRDVTCDETLENISRRSVFDRYGHFVEMKYSLSYAQNFPSTTLPEKNPLPCYVVAPVPPPGKMLTETSPPPLPQ